MNARRLWAPVFLGFLLGVCAGACGASAAEPPACPPYTKAVTLDFQTLASPPIYNNRLNVAGIRNLFATRGLALAGPHQRALGVTTSQVGFAISGSSMAMPFKNGYCVYFNSVQAQFGWDRMEVFVAADYAPESCEYRAVLDHENQHVALSRAALSEYAPQVRAALENLLRQQAAVFSREPQGTGKVVLADLQRRMTPMLDRFQTAFQSRNSAIDTSSNYGAIAQLCPNWNKPVAPPR